MWGTAEEAFCLRTQDNRSTGALESFAQRRKPALPLSMVHAGEKVRVSSLSGKDDSKRFMRNLGVVEDAELTVVAESCGNVIVMIKGTRLALSKAMARRVMTY